MMIKFGMADYKTTIRRLVPGDETMVDAFLEPHTASSMFLRSNLRKAGLLYQGESFQGIYMGAFEDGALRGVIAHYYNGNVMVQAPENHLADLATAILSESPLPLKGLLAPYAQARKCLDVWGLQDGILQKSQREVLFDLKLKDLQVPQDIADGSAVVRRSKESDLDQLVDWHVQYDIEALSRPNKEELRAENIESLNRGHSTGVQFVLEKGGTLVAMCIFNATLDDIVQIGGVYTPPDLRGRGYGRAVVAGALNIGKSEGANKAILFTGDDNIAAQKPYRAIGFREIGDYYIGLFGQDARTLIKDTALSNLPANQPLPKPRP